MSEQVFEWSDLPLWYMLKSHGHVAKRPDGVLARCGGPALCSECELERGYLQLLENYRRVTREKFFHDSLSLRQRELVKKHGTPAEFAQAVYKSVPGYISMTEAADAVEKYTKEFNESA